MTTTPTLVLNNVTKSIAGREIITGCNIALYPGEVCAIIGPNGAGKTTLFKLIPGLTFPSSGDITITGCKLDSNSNDTLLAKIGATIEAPEFQADVTAIQALQLHFDLLGLTDHASIDDLLAKVGLTASTRSPVASFSLGMKQRLALARAIGHHPALLVLDEPTNGLDVTGISEFRSLIAELSAAGVTVLIASHILTELERTAHSIAVLANGRLGSKRDMKTILSENGDLETFYN